MIHQIYARDMEARPLEIVADLGIHRNISNSAGRTIWNILNFRLNFRVNPIRNTIFDRNVVPVYDIDDYKQNQWTGFYDQSS